MRKKTKGNYIKPEIKIINLSIAFDLIIAKLTNILLQFKIDIDNCILKEDIKKIYVLNKNMFPDDYPKEFDYLSVDMLKEIIIKRIEDDIKSCFDAYKNKNMKEIDEIFKDYGSLEPQLFSIEHLLNIQKILF